jgi:hydroxyethylthiazole kinase-like uncharacterized protein yjeF
VSGAVLLAGLAALRAGAGRLQIATTEAHADALGIAVPEALVLGLEEGSDGAFNTVSHDLGGLVKRADAMLVGPGLRDSEHLSQFCAALIREAEETTTFVFDAGAIKAIGTSKEFPLRNATRCIFTPHAGEMAGLMKMDRAAVEADPAVVASRAAKAFGAIVVLKGACTYVTSPEGELAVCRDGNVGLATSGSGDVLGGIIAGLAARGAEPFVAAAWGVFLHAKAGDRLASKVGPLGYLARELLNEIPKLLVDVRSDEKCAGI